jgi:hypothetical protein
MTNNVIRFMLEPPPRRLHQADRALEEKAETSPKLVHGLYSQYQTTTVPLVSSITRPDSDIEMETNFSGVRLALTHSATSSASEFQLPDD